MGRMARQAALVGFHRSMLEDERPYRVRVALRANGELTGGVTHLMAGLGTVRIVAIAALDETGIHAMAVRPCKFCFLGGVAAVAQGSLRFH